MRKKIYFYAVLFPLLFSIFPIHASQLDNLIGGWTGVYYDAQEKLSFFSELSVSQKEQDGKTIYWGIIFIEDDARTNFETMYFYEEKERIYACEEHPYLKRCTEWEFVEDNHVLKGERFEVLKDEDPLYLGHFFFERS